MRQRSAAHVVYGHREPKPSVVARRIWSQCKRALERKTIQTADGETQFDITELRDQLDVSTHLSDIFENAHGLDEGAVGVAFDIRVMVKSTTSGTHRRAEWMVVGNVAVNIATRWREETPAGEVERNHFDIDVKKSGKVPAEVTQCLDASMRSVKL